MSHEGRNVGPSIFSPKIRNMHEGSHEVDLTYIYIRAIELN